MNAIKTISWLTFHEARRRRMVLAALVMGGLFLLLYTLGVALIDKNLQEEQNSAIQMRFGYNLLLIAGLYVVHFLTVMLAIFASVDTIAGEIATHTIQTLVTKPVRRWQIVLGKWLGYAAMLLIYLGLLGGGIFLVMYLVVGYTPPNPLAGLSLLMLEALGRRASFLMQPPIMSSIPTPFSGTTPPSQAMVIYAALYAAAALGLAMR